MGRLLLLQRRRGSRATRLHGGRVPGSPSGVASILNASTPLFTVILAHFLTSDARSVGVTPMATATGQVTASSVLLVPLVLVVDRPWTLSAPGPAAIGALIGLAAISTAFAYVLYFRVLATAGATNLLLVTFLIPVSAILLGTLFLHETPMPKHVAGMAMIGFGLAAIDGRPWQALRQWQGKVNSP
jgi:drug/metabolite transporter (DMT)-like permease